MLPYEFISVVWKLCSVWLCVIYPDKEGFFHKSPAAQPLTISLHSFSRYWRNATHAKCANKGRRRNYLLLWNAVWHADSCACAYTHTHTHTHSFMDTQRDPEGGEKRKSFSLTLSLTEGVTEFSEWEAKIWRRIQLQLVFHICVGCSGFQIKSAS